MGEALDRDMIDAAREASEPRPHVFNEAGNCLFCGIAAKLFRDNPPAPCDRIVHTPRKLPPW